MKFFSTSHQSQPVSLEEALTSGLASDGGLLMPESIPQLSSTEISDLKGKSFSDIAEKISWSFFHDDFTATMHAELITRAFNFPVVLKEIEEQTIALELFHGPTLAFKDFGTRYLASLLEFFLKQKNQKLKILVATSGDTGGAVANAFLGSEYIDVIILYPSGKVSKLQEQQLTTLGKNITALEILGTFDDCQALVKQALNDSSLQTSCPLTSANSINIARFIPQSFYYFYAYSQLESNLPLVFSVPSGNFGNLAAGVLAFKMGLPVAKFLAATNINKTVPDYLSTGIFTPRPSVLTLSNAMDVGNPSNFARLLELFDHDYSKITSMLEGYYFTDEQTATAVKETYEQRQYLLDPHGAIAYLALKDYQIRNKVSGVFLETAHPAKFNDSINKILQKEIEIPATLQSFLELKKNSQLMPPQYEELKDFLLK